MNNQELKLLDGFRRLCPADRNIVMTAVSMALSAEEAARQECGPPSKCPICGTEKSQPADDTSSEKEVCTH